MHIYLHTDQSAAYEADFATLGLLANVRVLDIGAGNGKTVRDAVRALTDKDIESLIVPDDVRRHTPPLEVVKQCAHHLDLRVRSVIRFVHDRAAEENSNPAAPAVSPHGMRAAGLAAPVRTPVANN